MSRCYSCGRTIDEATAYSRVQLGDEVHLFCCPMCMSAVEAGHVQRKLIPHSFSNERVTAFIEYEPALHVGGDYARLHWAGPGRLYALVADISGHGVTSSLIMSRLSGEIEALLQRSQCLEEVGESLNRSIRALAGGRHVYLTLFGTMMDFLRGELVYMNCGHPAQLLYSASRCAWTRLQSNNLPVGLFGPEKFGRPKTGAVRFFPGDKLILFTDGILDLERTGEPLGEAGLVEALKGLIESPRIEAADAAFESLRVLQNRESGDDLLLAFIDVKTVGGTA